MWLLGAIGLAWAQSMALPLGLSLASPVTDFLGGLLVGGGIVLMLMAVVELRRHATTVIPHRDAHKLVQSGIYARSRNPIYLGDVLVLAGLILRLDAVASLILIPLFVWIVTTLYRARRKPLAPDLPRGFRALRPENAPVALIPLRHFISGRVISAH